MLKPLMGLAATGIAALLLWKFFVLLLLPLFGVAVAVVFTVLKIGFIVFAVMFALWLFKRLMRSESATG